MREFFSQNTSVLQLHPHTKHPEILIRFSQELGFGQEITPQGRNIVPIRIKSNRSGYFRAQQHNIPFENERAIKSLN